MQEQRGPLPKAKPKPQPQPRPKPADPPCRHRTLTSDGKRCAGCNVQIYL
ncbi:hypothetical protein [Streptomyces xiaopingdaonensis]|nr:hypothetical protein [Streptomyces xiaopingdaonensis]